jgi:predicted HAD superfamily Cof-like phosphohydrolase
MPDVTFTFVLRGYDSGQVNDLIRRANLALASPDPAHRAEVERQLRRPGLRISLRGYDRSQVAERLATLADQLTAW